MQAYQGRPKNYAIESVYCLQIWSDEREITQSKVKLKKRVNDNKQKISIEWADYSEAGFRYIEDSTSTYFFNFNRWYLIDVFIFAGQGLFSIPPVNLIDAAHLNGVKILGAIMAPVFQPQYTTQFSLLFSKNNNTFPLADKLVEVTQHYGFDGWFINIEESLPPDVDWTQVKDFMIYLRQELLKLNSSAELHWYDSNYVFGNPSYDNCLDESNSRMFQYNDQTVSDGFFMNYAWDESLLQSSYDQAVDLKRDSFDVYAGVYFPDTFQSGSIPNSVTLCLKNGLSVGIWNVNYKQMANDRDQYMSFEKTFWNSIKKVTNVREQPITVPFCTNFCTGSGDSFWVDGDRKSNDSWGNISAADLSPSTDLKYSTSTVFEGGSSIIIDTNGDIELFKTYLMIDKPAIISIITDIPCDIKPYIGDNTIESRSFTWINGWVCQNFTVQPSTTPIRSFGISFMGDTPVHLGRISISYKDSITQVSNLTIKRLRWMYDDQLNIFPSFFLEWKDTDNRCFDVYYKRPDFGSFQYLKRAYRDSTYIDNIDIKGNVITSNNIIQFKVVSVGYDGSKSDISSAPTVDLTWNPPLNYASNVPIIDSD